MFQLPLIKGKSVPMISELPDEEQNHRSKWPETATFVTIERNVLGNYISESAKEAIEMGLNRRNKVRTFV